jgi:hypothetical protein
MVEISMTVEQRPVKLTDVPQGFCPKCGGRVYKAETLARIEATMKSERLDRQLNRASL